SDVIGRDDIDAAIIATPVRYHYDMAIKCLESGKHVLVEKPMAPSVKECKEIIDTAVQKRLIAMVGHTFVYAPTVRKIKEIIDSGELGKIQYVSSRRLNLGLFQKDINVAWDLAPHDISIIIYVLGTTPTGVNCQGKAHFTEGIEDVTNMTLTYSNGMFATIQSSWLDPNKVREMTFVGDKKMLVYDDTEPLEKIKIYDKRVEIPPHYDTFAEFQYSYHYGDIYSPYVKQAESLKFECQHFIDCMKSGKKPDSDGTNGLQVVQILEAASQSLKSNGRQISVDSLESIGVIA
ncbi:MAG: Gfo/Idh/MocA family oxidoreductase, partial [bacterium]|nr:Gfo/Idh/MocA family oxidoreductase [bacterium]